jgi:hypothetical protein
VNDALALYFVDVTIASASWPASGTCGGFRSWMRSGITNRRLGSVRLCTGRLECARTAVKPVR